MLSGSLRVNPHGCLTSGGRAVTRQTGSLRCDLLGISPRKNATLYPLVNIQKIMENHHVEWINQRSMAIFNSYVSLPEGNNENFAKQKITWVKIGYVQDIPRLCYGIEWHNVGQYGRIDVGIYLTYRLPVNFHRIHENGVVIPVANPTW